MRVLPGIAWLLLSLPAAAQTRVVVTPTPSGEMEQHVGAEWRDDVTAAFEAIMAGDIALARSRVQPALDFCEALARPNLALVSVATTAEYERYLAERGDGNPVEWVDHACPAAYKTAGFLVIEEQGHADAAMRHLDQAIAIAPYWSDPLVERGFLLNRLGRPQEALAAYRRAIELQREFDSAMNRNKAIAWRGLGYTYVELGDFDNAQAAYEHSLELEPGNSLALQELEYIRTRRAGR